MDMNTLLTALYTDDTSVPSLEKTAEAALLQGLEQTSQVEDNPFMQLSTEELVKLAQELDNAPLAETEESSDELEKVAFDMLGGQIMAHAMVHEFGLMKQAMVSGVCRVCKETPMDIEGSSICSSCTHGE
jgi:hypothetical protein